MQSDQRAENAAGDAALLRGERDLLIGRIQANRKTIAVGGGPPLHPPVPAESAAPRGQHSGRVLPGVVTGSALGSVGSQCVMRCRAPQTLRKIKASPAASPWKKAGAAARLTLQPTVGGGGDGGDGDGASPMSELSDPPSPVDVRL